ncbi:MAG: DUF4186 family protein [Akkermansia sp.]|nr:DUF4186 family protein [Akkermansia sp.]
MLAPLSGLMQSSFHRRFRLSAEDAAYIRRIGMEKLRAHAADFIRQRLSPAYPVRDGHQTPMRGHPVFKAQHACACCCRRCLHRWHGIPQGRELTPDEQSAVVALLLEWIDSQTSPQPFSRRSPQQGMFDF